MKWIKWVQFSKRERNGLLVILVIIPLVYSLPYWFDYLHVSDGELHPDQLNAFYQNNSNKELAHFAGNQYHAGSGSKYASTPVSQPDDSVRIYNDNRNDQSNYSYAGNAYNKNSYRGFNDYSGNSNRSNRSNNNNSYSSITKFNANQKYSPTNYPQSNKTLRNIPPASIDINTATAETFQELPGIGPVLSSRIINFRNKLGRFTSLEQLGRTYGLSDSVFSLIKPFLLVQVVTTSSNKRQANTKDSLAGNLNINNHTNDSTYNSHYQRPKTIVKTQEKINLNEAGISDFSAHPYIKYKLALQLIAFRKEHGPFTDIQDLQFMMGIDSVQLQQLDSYLKFSD